eukprot:6124909-Amphidinium_carterae.1
MDVALHTVAHQVQVIASAMNYSKAGSHSFETFSHFSDAETILQKDKSALVYPMGWKKVRIRSTVDLGMIIPVLLFQFRKLSRIQGR